MKSTVSIVKGQDVKEMVLKALGLIGGIDRVIERGHKVLIKPNWVSSTVFLPKSGGITKPEIVKFVAELAWDAGAGDVTIGEGGAVGRERAFVESLVRSSVPETGKGVDTKVVDFGDLPFDKVSVPNPCFFKSLRIARSVLECDVLISLPVFKTHHEAGVTLTLKNMYGAIPVEDKMRFHVVDRLEESIVDINSVRKADLIIVDGTVGQEGIAGGLKDDHPVPLGIMAAGFDSVAVDTVCAEVMGVDHTKVCHISWAAEKGLGINNLSGIEVVGEPIESVYRRFKTPCEDVNEEHRYLKIVDGGACTKCYARFATALIHVDDRSLERPVYVLVGSEAAPPVDGISILVGKCLKKRASEGIFIPGCPPSIRKLIDELKGHGATVSARLTKTLEERIVGKAETG